MGSRIVSRFQVTESATGDEIWLEASGERIALSVRGEMGTWITIELRPEAAREVAVALEHAATAAVGP